MQMYPTKVPTPPTLFHGILPMLIAFKTRIVLSLPRGASAHVVGTVVPLLGWLTGIQAILYEFTNMKNPKQIFINQSRWDPLKNACMMVKLKRKATVFRYPSPSFPTIPTIYKYRERYKSRR